MPKSTLTFFSLLMIILVAGAITFGFYNVRKSQLQKSSEAFSVAFSQSFLTSWNLEFFKQHCSKEFCDKLSDEAFNLMFENMKRIGNLQEIMEIESTIHDLFVLNSSASSTTIVMKSSFQNENGEIYLDLVQEDNTWKVNNLFINSAYLAD